MNYIYDNSKEDNYILLLYFVTFISIWNKIWKNIDVYYVHGIIHSKLLLCIIPCYVDFPGFISFKQCIIYV